MFGFKKQQRPPTRYEAEQQFAHAMNDAVDKAIAGRVRLLDLADALDDKATALRFRYATTAPL